jgi:protein phosphatase
MNKIIVMVGAPGSGKSTWIEKYNRSHPHVSVLSSDALRAVYGRDENDQSVSGKVFQYMEAEADSLVRNGNTVLIDATNMHRKARKPWVDLAKKYGVVLEAYVFIVDKDILIERNKKRGAEGGRDVPADVIERMLNNYVTPSREEGFDIVHFVK